MIKSYTTTVTLVVLCAILMANVALCDLYMHNPRGSINRNCERDANRRNANRLFDSQDNAAGGYACPRQVGGPEVKTPKMYYYEGSELYLEWTSQHSCGEHNNYCELVIQYMCNDTVVGNHPVYGDFYAVRDGIPRDGNDDATETVSEATMNDLRFGVHEQYENYYKCDKRRRNAGLYIADRNVGSRATATRQNNNAERFGFECTEERDYYPYWHNSPWVDIAIFTSNTSMCSWYQENSQNVAPRGECWDAGKKNYLEFNNIRDCTDNAKTNIWVETPAWNVAPPECLSASLVAARDNYLGNSVDGEHARYKWTIPFIEKMPYDSVAKKTHHENCVLRMRYNITTTETPFFMDYKYNYRVGDKTSATPIRQDPWETFGYKSELHLAVNTNQYGRTFEDRSYVFEIRERPASVPKWVTIHNLNVRGKRGNIVNVFPSVEYDFIPSVLNINAGSDLVHFQWSGSDYNPNRTPNNAEGGPKDPAQAGYRADRSNIVQMDVAGLNTPRKFSGITMFLKEDGTIDTDLVHKLAFLGQNIADNVTSCLSKTALLDKNGQNTANAELDNNNCGKLANTPYGPYFDGGLVKMWASGKFYYMCTRNNNFSNRGQKAIMIVNGGKFSAAPAVAPSSMTTWMVALCSVLILTFNMLF